MRGSETRRTHEGEKAPRRRTRVKRMGGDALRGGRPPAAGHAGRTQIERVPWCTGRARSKGCRVSAPGRPEARPPAAVLCALRAAFGGCATRRACGRSTTIFHSSFFIFHFLHAPARFHVEHRGAVFLAKRARGALY